VLWFDLINLVMRAIATLNLSFILDACRDQAGNANLLGLAQAGEGNNHSEIRNLVFI
jgi:hypothetical protein